MMRDWSILRLVNRCLALVAGCAVGLAASVGLAQGVDAPVTDQGVTNVGEAKANEAKPAKPDKPGSFFSEKPAAIAGLDVVEALGTKIPLDVPLIDTAGKPVKIGDWFNQGKPVVVLFVFHRCPLACPQLLEHYAKAFRDIETLQIGCDYNVVVISIDPTDKPETAAAVKSQWMTNYGRSPEKDVAAGWAFLTSPDPSASRKVADALGYQYRYVPKSNDYAHPSVAFVLSPEGMVCRYLYGIAVPAQTVRLALVEAGEGKIGTTADRFILWCFHFDPKSGSYTFAAWRLMQVGGFLSAIVVGLLLVRMLAHEWKRKFAGEAVAVTTPGAPITTVKTTDQAAGDAEFAR